MKKNIYMTKFLPPLVMALLTFCIWLAVSSMHIPFSDFTLLKYLSVVGSAFGDAKSVPDSLLIVDVSFDKTFVEVSDEMSLPKGKADITDRAKICRLLQIARKSDYRYILLDVYFDTDYTTPYDSLLFALIQTTPRLLVPKHSDTDHLPSALAKKAAYSDYFVTPSLSDFEKYPFFENGEPTMATKAYEELTANRITDCGFFAVDGGSLSLRTIIPTLDLHDVGVYDAEQNKNIYFLGEDILPLGEDAKTLMDGKYIMVGAVSEHDMHQSVRGDIPGVLIHYDVLSTLMRHRHCIPLWFIVLLLVVFGLMSYVCYNGKPILYERWPLLSFVLTWLGYAAVLSVITVFSFYCLGVIFDVFITATIFTIYKQAINILRNEKK